MLCGVWIQRASRGVRMSEYNEIGNMVLQEFIGQIEKRGLTVSEMLPETGQLSIRNADGGVMLISLLNLVDYYYRSRDEHAVRDFVAKVVASANPRMNPAWDKAKRDIYISLYPTTAKVEPPFAKEFSGYSSRYFILDTPDKSIWVTPGMLEEWNITEETLERQALANGNALLAETDLHIERIEGHPLGSFKVRDRTLNAALLTAPAFKEKAGKAFGWPLYAVIPNKVTCCFFGQPDFTFFEERMGVFVANNYDNPRHITPELLKFSDTGVTSICTWTRKMGYIIKFDGDGA